MVRKIPHRKRRNKELDARYIPELKALQQLNLNAAGLDIGDAEIYAAVPEGRDERSVRVFETFTADLHALADWLEACGVETVAMESTGVYWIPSYEILEARGFEVCLVNARHVKNVTGRKTDILDCQWLQQLHTYGLLRASFRPPEDICALRALVRHRGNLIKSCISEIQRMQKALQQMNVKLTNVVSDVTGQTGMGILRDIVAGVRDPQKLAEHRDPRCAKSKQQIADALYGNYKPEHVFALKQALEAYDFYQRQIKACDDEIEKQYTALEPQVDLAETPLPSSNKPRRKPRGNAPEFDLRTHLYEMSGVDLTQIDGVESLLAQTILSEIGVDMSKWATAKHFTSWLGLCPYNDKTGGRVIRTSTKKTQNRAAGAFRMAAQTLTHSHSALGSYCRRMRTKLGKPEAITATAHKLARIVYAMLKNNTNYRDVGETAYEEQARKRAIKTLKRKAKTLGFALTPTTA